MLYCLLNIELEIKGNLFNEETENKCLTHCVGGDFKMGVGVALDFNRMFGRQTELKSQKKTVGQCAKLKDGNRYLFYLVTKKTSYKTYYESIKRFIGRSEKTTATVKYQ